MLDQTFKSQKLYLTAEYSEVLKDVYAVLHVASPTGLARNISGKELFEVSFFCVIQLTLRRKGAYHGTYYIVSAAINAGIKKIVATGTILNLLERKCYYSMRRRFGHLTTP